MRHLSALSWALCLMLSSAMIHAAGPGFITYQGSLLLKICFIFAHKPGSNDASKCPKYPYPCYHKQGSDESTC